MSVFQKTRVHPMGPKCSHGHALVRYELVACDQHKAHRVYVCPMRRGSRACGETLVQPAWTPQCSEDGVTLG